MGEIAREPDALDFGTARVEPVRPELSEQPPQIPPRAAQWEKPVAGGISIFFVLALLAIALFVPNPTTFQLFVFRVVLALAAVGIGAIIPGVIKVNVHYCPVKSRIISTG